MLGELGDNEAVPLLMKLLRSDQNYYGSVCFALAEIGDEVSLKELENLQGVNLGQKQTLEEVKMKMEKKKKSEEMFKEKTPEKVKSAYYKIMIKTTSWDIVKENVDILVAFKETKTICEILNKNRNAYNKDAFTFLMNSLGELKDKESIETLINVASKKGNEYADYIVIARAMTKIKDERFVEPMIKILKNIKDPSYAKEVIIEMGKFGDSRFITPIIEQIKIKTVSDKGLSILVDYKAEEFRRLEEIRTALVLIGPQSIPHLIKSNLNDQIVKETIDSIKTYYNIENVEDIKLVEEKLPTTDKNTTSQNNSKKKNCILQ